MDHLPKVKLFEGSFLKVPYLSDRDYDGGCFEEYPMRREWDLKRLVSRDYTEHPPDETASFLQTWLFFGTLHEILEHNGGKADEFVLTEDETGKKWISTVDLDIRVREWAEYTISLTDQEGQVEEVSTNKLISCLTVLKTVTDILSGSDACPLPDEVILSIKVLGSTIDTAFAWYWNIRRHISWGLKDLAASRMTKKGWCPRDIASTSRFLSDIAMLYASYIERDYQQQDHSNCSENMCVVNQIDESSYRTKHTTEKCLCSHIEPDQDEIRKILKKGQVPVIALTPSVAPDGSKTLDVGIKAYSYLRWFVAISHVWSDGLGNSQKNSLPMCQLQALYDLVVDRWWDEMFVGVEEILQEAAADPELSGKWQDRIDRFSKKTVSSVQAVVSTVRERRGKPISIWIDTLCVPLEKTHRKMAISGLKSVYSAAMFTVVLDSELQRTSCTCSAEENLLRIAVSGWMRRAWTFQEGVLANLRLRIKFADGLIDLSKLLGEDDPNNDVGVDSYLVQNPKVTKAMQKLMRFNEANMGSAEKQKRSEKEIERKKNYTMSTYIADEAKIFFQYMVKVWMMPFHKDVSAETARRIVAAWMGLLSRETSRKEDKFIIFATACVSSPIEVAAVHGLLNYPIHGRMKLWLSQQISLPAGFLFVPGRRYQEVGWGWAPLIAAAENIEDDTCIERTPEDTYLQVAKSGFLLSLDESLMKSSFIYTDAEKELKCIVQLDQAYMGMIEADIRPSLPPRPTGTERPPLPPRPEQVPSTSFKSEVSVKSQDNLLPPTLPPRPQPVLSYSFQSDSSRTSQEKSKATPFYSQKLQSESSFASQESLPLHSRNPGLSYDSKSSVETQSSSTNQKKTPKRRVPAGTTFALILLKPLILSGFNEERVAGALMTVSLQSEESIQGLFICSVIVEIIRPEDGEKSSGPTSTVVEALSESQVWRVG